MELNDQRIRTLPGLKPLMEHKVIRQEEPEFSKIEKDIMEVTKPNVCDANMDIVLVHTIHPGNQDPSQEWGVWAVTKSEHNKCPLATGLMTEREAQFVFDAVMRGIHFCLLHQKPMVF